jgi:hypothetical protein
VTKKQQQLALERIALAVRRYASDKKLPLDGLAEKFEVSRATVYNLAGSENGRRPARSTAIPSGDVLTKLSRVTGASVDWLLGFDVPMMREVRQAIGDFAGRLKENLALGFDGPVPTCNDNMEHAPDDAWGNEWVRHFSREGDEFPYIRFPDTAEELVQEVVFAYWQQRLQDVAEDHAPAFQELALMLRKQSRELDRKDARRYQWICAAMDHAARQSHAFAAVLASKDVDWEAIHDLEPFPIEIEGALAVADAPEPHSLWVPRTWTPFGASGGKRGAAFAYSEDGETFAMWWVDRRTGEPRVDAGLAGGTRDEPPFSPPIYDDEEAPSSDYWFTHRFDEYPMPTHK